jgi:hypothetical protein
MRIDRGVLWCLTPLLLLLGLWAPTSARAQVPADSPVAAALKKADYAVEQIVVLGSVVDPGEPSPEAVRGGDDGSVRDPWQGFPVGSWIIESEIVKQGDQVKQTRREKSLRIQGAGGLPTPPDRIVRSIRPEQDGEFRDTGRLSLHVPGAVPAAMEGAKLIAMRSETLEIDGESYECDVKTWRVTGGRQRAIEAKYTLWQTRALDIPYREVSSQGPDLAMSGDVLRAEVEIQGPDYTEAGFLQIKSMRDERKVGMKSVVCIREEGRFETEARGRRVGLSLTRWISSDVPGHVVLSVTEGSLDGERIERRREVIEFHVADESPPDRD